MKELGTTTLYSDLLDKVKIYAEIENRSITSFLSELVTDALERYLLERSGGASFTLPNPQIFTDIDLNKARITLDYIASVVPEINKAGANLHIPFYPLLAFYETRLFIDSAEDRERFKENLLADGTQNENVVKDK